ncbi:MAG: hypothetical protein LBC97_12760 [Bifidobacteriaceae bacterium]|jgi:hypothetical protein|nr:hypothetical protein [Bifidobacteriaceae bacterium]
MRRLALALLAATALAVSVGAPAQAVTYLDEAVQGLADSQIWQSQEVPDRIDFEKVLGADPLGRVAVAVLPGTAKLEASPSDFAVDIREKTDWTTVLVAAGVDLSADSLELRQAAAQEPANKAEDVAGDLEDKLVAAVAGLAEALDQAEDQGEVVDGEDWTASADDVGAGAGRTVVRVVLWTLFFVVVVPLTLIGLLIFFLVRRFGGRGAGKAPLKPSKATPGDVADQLEQLRALRVRYLNVRTPTPAMAPAKAMAQMITRIVTDTSELFRRLERRGAGDQKAVARVEYHDQVAKVVEVLGEDYYLDILTRPDLWDDPAGRARAVEAAVAAFSEQIVNNIKQVNAAQDLRFQVSLDALARAKRDQAAGLYDAPDSPHERPKP